MVCRSLARSLPKLGLDEGGQGDEVEHRVDEEEGGGEDEADAEVEPPVEEKLQILSAGEAVPLLQIVRAVHVPAPEAELRAAAGQRAALVVLPSE